MYDFWSTLDFFIEKSPYSRKEIEAELGLPKGSITLWKHRKTYPSFEVGYLICSLLKISMEALMKPQLYHLQSESPFSRALKEEMDKKKLSADELASLSDVPKDIVYRYLSSGDHPPDVNYLAQIAKHLGCGVEYLTGYAHDYPDLRKQAEQLVNKIDGKKLKTAIELIKVLDRADC